MNTPYYCPGCGQKTLRIIESVPGVDESKDICTCDRCGNMVHVFREPTDEEAAEAYAGNRDD